MEGVGTEGLVDGMLMLAFEGTTVPERMRSLLARRAVAGFTLFPPLNVESPEQVRALTADLQSLSGDGPPLLIAADQEGGQLIGLGEGTTPFAGNMAIGATGDPELAERVGRAMGRELRALGVNVNYAPVCDVATDPANPSLGIRAFGDDPEEVGRLSAAMVRGFQGQGAAATLKHFPGKGAAVVDPHHELPRLDHDRARLDQVELVPFRSGIEAGAGLVMVGHYALPRITGRLDLPTSLSRRVVEELLRHELGYPGVVITDALDMGALPQGAGQAIDVVAAARAGVDLLLCTADTVAQDRVAGALAQGASRELIDPAQLARSVDRVRILRGWLAGFDQPGLEVVNGEDHRSLARELAERSVTLLRDDPGLLPLRPGAHIAVIAPRPVDLTPADTSSTVRLTLARELGARGLLVEELLTDHAPSPAEVDSLRSRASSFDVLVVGTTAAFREPTQAAMVAALHETGVPVVTVALREPWDLAAYPGATTHVCTYGILEPSMTAAARAMCGELPFRGRLPVGIPELHPRGHGITA